MKFTLRKLAGPDCQAYKELRLHGFLESSLAFSESYEDERLQPIAYFASCMGAEAEHFTIGAFSQAGRLAAVATFKRDKRLKARHKSYIHTMYVAPDFRREGLAGEILNKLIEEARSAPGLEQIHLWVLNPETSPAKKLYEKHGFVSQGTVVKKDLKIDGVYVDAGYMVLFLNS